MTKLKLLLAALTAAISITSAQAQFPTQVNPNGNGGYNVYDPNR
jgi:hypothetical protein